MDLSGLNKYIDQLFQTSTTVKNNLAGQPITVKSQNINIPGGPLQLQLGQPSTYGGKHWSVSTPSQYLGFSNVPASEGNLNPGADYPNPNETGSSLYYGDAGKPVAQVGMTPSGPYGLAGSCNFGLK